MLTIDVSDAVGRLSENKKAEAEIMPNNKRYMRSSDTMSSSNAKLPLDCHRIAESIRRIIGEERAEQAVLIVAQGMPSTVSLPDLAHQIRTNNSVLLWSNDAVPTAQEEVHPSIYHSNEQIREMRQKAQAQRQEAQKRREGQGANSPREYGRAFVLEQKSNREAGMGGRGSSFVTAVALAMQTDIGVILRKMTGDFMPKVQTSMLIPLDIYNGYMRQLHLIVARETGLMPPHMMLGPNPKVFDNPFQASKQVVCTGFSAPFNENYDIIRRPEAQ